MSNEKYGLLIVTQRFRNKILRFEDQIFRNIIIVKQYSKRDRIPTGTYFVKILNKEIQNGWILVSAIKRICDFDHDYILQLDSSHLVQIVDSLCDLSLDLQKIALQELRKIFTAPIEKGFDLVEDALNYIAYIDLKKMMIEGRPLKYNFILEELRVKELKNLTRYGGENDSTYQSSTG